MYNLRTLTVVFASLLALASCQEATVDQTGSEYMPDMAHSIAYEANTYFTYYQNTWNEASVKSKYELVQPGLPVKGTVPRGYAGYFFANESADKSGLEGLRSAMAEVKGLNNINSIMTPINGSVPYYYPDTKEGRLEATEDIQKNPFPITEDGLTRGKELYNTFCATCHGVKGDGNGFIYENGKYPAAPRNFLVQEWADTSAGHYYHAIMYGKNVMGSYADKVSYEERWQIIHHIRNLQAGAFGGAYTPDENTFLPKEAMAIAGYPEYAKFLESFTREPMDYEAQESNTPHVDLPKLGVEDGHHDAHGDEHHDDDDDHSDNHSSKEH